MPCTVMTPAMRLLTPQSKVLTAPPGPTFAATSIAVRAPVLWPIRMTLPAGAG